ncbi:MAG TPA: Gfo/Idh/MocA family oxidoreductase [Chthoniobacteraceae bacterium]|nr:Gfo/Idh/MocA family oxidoreductase [Chthoniobacteraceae bacterium]
MSIASPFKVAVIGAGRMGTNVLRHLKQCADPVALIACDPSPEALEAACRATGATPMALGDLLADPQVRLVFITSSNHTHKELAIAALRAGKAVLCEKPIATTLEDSREVVRVAESLNAFLQIGFELRYSTLYTTVKEWIDHGLLGDLRSIQCSYLCSEFWGPSSWRVRAATGGSMFGEKLSHYVDLPRWWIGRPASSIYAACAPNVIPYFEVRDNYHATTRFQGGAVSHLTFMMAYASNSKGDPLVDTLHQQKDDGHELRFQVMGSRGGAETNVFHRHLRRWEYRTGDRGFRSELVEERQWEPAQDHAYFHNTLAQTLDVVERVQKGLPPRFPASDALTTMEHCHAADLAADEGRVIHLQPPSHPLAPPLRPQFPGQPKNGIPTFPGIN